jgi:iron complex transport system ATP-binding protein
MEQTVIDTAEVPSTVHATPAGEALRLESLRVGYEKRVICESVDLQILRGSYTAVIGPNACGKSTLLRAVARVLPTMAGSVLLDGRDIREVPTKELATRLGLLPQTSLAPEGIRVADLVARGRYPHQGMFDRWSERDETAVIAALEATGITDLSGRLVEELSGGQRQRVWVAMALAQETPVLLLDEPTTFLDITHQYGLLDLFERLRTGLGRTVVVVLHDLNQAARFADHLVVMKAGAVVAAGPPAEILTAELVEEVYELPCRVMPDPETGAPMVIPRAMG